MSSQDSQIQTIQSADRQHSQVLSRGNQVQSHESCGSQVKADKSWINTVMSQVPKSRHDQAEIKS